MTRERDWSRIIIGLDLGNKEYIEIKKPWPWWGVGGGGGGGRFSKVPIINGPVKLLLFTGNSFAFNMIKLLVNEKKGVVC